MGCSVDFAIIFLSRFVRLFSYGMIAVVLFLYLQAINLTTIQIGGLLTFILLGDIVMTFLLTTTADTMGRRNVLIIGAVLKCVTGVGFAYLQNFWLLALVGAVGVITPTGAEIGPFLAVEQAVLTQIIGSDKQKVASVFAWYNLLGYFAQATGGVVGGWMVTRLQSDYGLSPLEAYRWVVITFACLGGIKLLLTLCLSSKVEPAASSLKKAQWWGKFGLHQESSRSIVAKLSALFVVDAFAGGFVMQTLIVYWFHKRFGMAELALGTLLMGCNVLAGISALCTVPLVGRIGAIKTMVYTHLPSNILLLLVPLVPGKTAAIGVLLARFCISQMDVPARQAYVTLVVAENERSAAGGITNLVRSIGVAASPVLAGKMVDAEPGSIVFALPFIIAGGLKIIYDIAVWILFNMHEPPNKPADVEAKPKETSPLLSNKKGH